MVKFFRIPNAIGYADNGDGTYRVDFVESSRPVTVDEIVAAKRLKLAQDIDDLVAEKIAIIFDKPIRSVELATKELNLHVKYTKLGKLLAIAAPEDVAAIETEMTLLESYWDRVSALQAYGKAKLTELASTDPDNFNINAGWPE